MNEPEVALPAVSPKTGKVHSLIVPFIAICAMLLSIAGLFGLAASNQAAVHRNCETNLKTYQTLTKIIDHVEKPAVLAGQKITAAQHAALHAYADNLRQGLPTEVPQC